MIQSSSKRLAKIKKRLKKNEPSDYHFLIGSMERQSNKQNYTSNIMLAKHNKTSLKNSIEICKPSSMINSFDYGNKHSAYEKIMNEKIYENEKYKTLNNCNKIKILKNKTNTTINNINNTIPIFQNIKFLKNSRIEENEEEKASQNNEVNDGPHHLKELTLLNYQSKQLQKHNKNINNNHNSKIVQFSLQKNFKNPKECKQLQKYHDKSNKFTQHPSTYDTLEQKAQTYIQFVNQLFEDMIRQYQSKERNYKLQRKKCVLNTLGKQLVREIANINIEKIIPKKLHQSIQVSNFCSFNSKTISRQLQKSLNPIKQSQDSSNFNYKQLIDNLSVQNNKLTQLISQHERKNIKMFIKMNQSESKEIEKCKKYVSTLYDKYKILEKYIEKQNKRCKDLEADKKLLEAKVKQLQGQNKLLLAQIQNIKQSLGQYMGHTASKLTFQQESSSTMFNFNLNQGNFLKLNTKSKIINPNISLCQKPTSKLQKSNITKRDKASSCLSTHAQIKKCQNEIMSCSTITKTKNMKKKKEKGKVCCINLKDQFYNSEKIEEKETQNLKISKIKELTQQANNLSKQNKQLKNEIQDLQKNMKKKDMKLQKMQTIINQQMQQIKKLMQLNKKSSNQLKNKQNQIKNNNYIQKQNNFIDDMWKIKTVSEKGKLLKNIQKINNKAEGVQYQIIALQASTIQKILNFSSN